jgi:hypothetical protein
MTLSQRAVLAVVACGALVAPGAAWADDMTGMNGMACEHASGEGPNALAAGGPTPERAPAVAPVGSTTPSASKPESPAPPPSTRSEPTSRVTQPPATTTTSVPATTTTSTPATSTATATATAPVAARERAERRRAHRARPKVEPPVPKHFGPVMKVGRHVQLSAGTPRATAAPAPSPDGFALPPLLLALAGLAVAGGALLVARRRGGDGGVAVGAGPAPAPLPASADPAVDAELHEIIAEAKARELLADEREPAGTR